MNPLDLHLIQRKVKSIEEDLKFLKSLSTTTLSRYKSTPSLKLQVERLLERIISRMIDINYHLLKTRYQTVPDDYYHSFLLLSQHKVISKKLAQELAQSAGLRNVLAHDYDISTMSEYTKV